MVEYICNPLRRFVQELEATLDHTVSSVCSGLKVKCPSQVCSQLVGTVGALGAKDPGLWRYVNGGRPLQVVPTPGSRAPCAAVDW